MKILFVGCIDISKVMLDFLIGRGEICGIITSPRTNISGYIDLEPFAQKHSIPLQRTWYLQSKLKFIKECQADLMIVYGWQRLIKPSALVIPKLGTIGFHASLLPKYRGSAPVNWAIINGETETGVTMFVLDAYIDSGPIIDQKAFPIEEYDTCATVYNKSVHAACQMLEDHFDEFQNGILRTRPNPSMNYPIFPRRRPQDGMINWNKTVRENHNWIRALTKPYPGAFTHLGGRRLYLWESKSYYTKLKQLSVGEHLLNDEGLVVGCKDGNILITNFSEANENDDFNLGT